MNAGVIVGFEPRLERTVQFMEGKRRRGFHFRFELTLQRLKEPLDQATWLRFARRPMQEPNVELSAGKLQAARVVDLGVVEVKFATCAVLRPRLAGANR